MKQPAPIARGAGRSVFVEAFAGWLTAFGDAWEARDAQAMTALFAPGATMQPTPFAPLVRGRPEITEYWQSELAAAGEARFGAQVLGAGDTYGVAHWRVSFGALEGGRTRVRDGILLAALDARGRCTSLRAWWHESEQPDR